MAAGVHIARMRPHMLRQTFVTTMLDVGVDTVIPRSLPAAPARATRWAGVLVLPLRGAV